MQERELAHRIVHFYQDEVVWHCRSKSACECGATPSLRRDSSFSTLRDIGIAHSQNDMVSDFGRRWTAVIEEYMSLALTHEADLLPALSGMAHYVHAQNASGQYIAGLWERDIVLQLCWHVAEPLGPSQRRADSPSFSWVALAPHVRWALHYSKRSGYPVPSFVSADVRLATRNPYGKISRCCVTMKIPSLTGNDLVMCLTKAEEAGAMRWAVFATYMDCEEGYSDIWGHSSLLEEVEHDLSTVTCLALWQDKTEIEALLLRPVAGR